MATAGEVVEGALKRLLVQADEAPLEASEYADGITDLNDFMFSLEGRGIKLGFSAVSDTGDEMTIPNGAIMGVKANLAIYISSQYGKQLAGGVAKEARDGMNSIRQIARSTVGTRYPTTLPIGSGTQDVSLRTSPFYDSSSEALITLNGNALATTIDTADTPVVVRGFWDIQHQKGHRAEIVGRVNYVGEQELKTTCNVSLTATGSGAYTYHIMQNGASKKTTSVTLSATAVTSTFSKSLTLLAGNYVEIYVEADAHTNNPTITDGKLELT